MMRHPARIGLALAVLSVAACSGSPDPTTPVGGTVSSRASSTSSTTTSTPLDTATTTSATPTGDPTGAGTSIEPQRTAFVSSVKVTVAKVQWSSETRALDVSGTVTNLGPLDGTLQEVLGDTPVSVEVAGALVGLSHPVPTVPVGSTTAFRWSGSLATAPDLDAAALVVGSSGGSRVRMPFTGPYEEPAAPVAHVARGTVVATKGLRATVTDSLVRSTYAQGEPAGTLVDLRVAGLGLVSQYGGYRFNADFLTLVDAGGNAVVGESTATGPDYLNVLDKGKRSDGWVTFRVDTWKPPYTLRVTLPDFSPSQVATKAIRLR